MDPLYRKETEASRGSGQNYMANTRPESKDPKGS